MGVGITNKPKIETRVRIRVLFDVICNLSSAFGFPDSAQRLLEIGILHQQVLKTITAYYMDNKNTCVGLVTFKIDWALHKMLAESSDGESLEIDNTKSLRDQYAEWAEDLVKYIVMMKKKYAVVRTDIRVTYIDELYYDSNVDKLQKVRESMGTHPCKKTDAITYNNSKVESFAREIECRSSFLPELAIVVQSRD